MKAHRLFLRFSLLFSALLIATPVVAQSISDPQSISINADSNADGTGTVEVKTRNTSRLSIGNTGSIGIGLPGDYGPPFDRALLNFKGFESKNYLIWKAWSSDPHAPTAANFSLQGNIGPNVYSTRGMQGYYMGINQSRSGLEFPNEHQWIDAWETFWDGYPGDAEHPAQERWTYIKGRNGAAGQRIMMFYSPLDHPENTSLEWTLNTIHFEDFTNRNIWMSFTPGKILFTTTPAAPHPKIVTDSGEPLVFKGTQAYPFVNNSGETEISRDTQVVRFMGGHDSIDPNTDYRFVLGSGSNRPELRYAVNGNVGWSFSNDGTHFTNLNEGTKGVYRQQYSLAAAAGSYTMMGSVGRDFSSALPRAFTVVISEGAGIDGGGRVFHVVLPAFGTQNVWKEVLPVTAATGLGADSALKLDVLSVNPSDDRVYLRVRRGAALGNSTTVYAEIRVYDRTGDFTISNETGTGASVADTLQVISASTKIETLLVDYGGGVTDAAGTGTPVGACVTGSTYRRKDGTAGATFYVCENSAWTAK